jgi:GNAT superfamily N-acetyltransferase
VADRGRHAAAPFRIDVAAPDDLNVAHEISRANMERYYTALGLRWDTDVFEALWRSTENHAIRERDALIGFLRLRAESDTIYISDLQIVPERQRRGAGTFALAYVERLAHERGITRMRLRAFTGSAAIRLYERAGFVKIADEREKQLFERSL